MSKINVEKHESLTGHKDCIYSIEQGAADNWIYTSGADGLVVAWDLENPEVGTMVAKVHNSVYAMAFDKIADKLYIGHNFEGVHMLDIASKTTHNSSRITESYIFDILIINDQILCACGDGILVILDKNTLETKRKINISKKSLRAISYHAETDKLAVGTSDHNIYILNADSLKLEETLSGHTNSVFTVKFHPTLPYLITAGRDAHIKIWNTLNFIIEEDIVAHTYAINNISFSPDGRFFASCSMDKSIKLWDAAAFKLLKVIDKARHAGHGTSVNKLLWTSHHDYLVSVSDDRLGAIWDIQVNM